MLFPLKLSIQRNIKMSIQTFTLRLTHICCIPDTMLTAGKIMMEKHKHRLWLQGAYLNNKRIIHKNYHGSKNFIQILRARLSCGWTRGKRLFQLERMCKGSLMEENLKNFWNQEKLAPVRSNYLEFIV